MQKSKTKKIGNETTTCVIKLKFIHKLRSKPISLTPPPHSNDFAFFSPSRIPIRNYDDTHDGTGPILRIMIESVSCARKDHVRGYSRTAGQEDIQSLEVTHYG